MLGIPAAQQLRAAMDVAGIRLVTAADPLAAAWPERAALPAAPVYEHRAPQAPTPRSAKLAQVREAMAARGASHHLVSTLDDLAWLFNLRGADVDYNPVFLAHALIDARRAELFVGAGKVDAALAATLAADGVALRPYADARAALAALPLGSTLLIDPKRVTLAFREAVPAGVKLVEAVNPSTLGKSRKTADEAAFVREAMADDGAAMCAFYAWFEQALGRSPITELTIAERLSAERETKAIIPVHIAGLPVEMTGIREVAVSRKLPVIEDAAHAFPSAFKGRTIGSLSEFTAFSFYATKTITTGEGGMLCTDNDSWADRCRIMSLHGISRDAWKRYTAEGTWYYEIVAPGYKYNLTDVAAAIGLAQLRKAGQMHARRVEIARTYTVAFSGREELQVPATRAD